MVKGRAFGRIKTLFSLLGVVGVLTAYGMITGWNPLPGWAAWLRDQTATVLSTPRPPWTVRAGDQPHAAMVLGTSIVVTSDGSVEARNPVTGDLLWRKLDSWAAVAGDAQQVVLVGRTVDSGFDVYDAYSSARLWGDDDHDGVWPYANMVLLMHCRGTDSCQLVAKDPVTGKVAWTAPFPGAGSALRGFDHPFATLVAPASSYTDALAGAPVDAPALLGFSTGGIVHVISTKDGHEVHPYSSDAQSRVVVAGGVALVTTAVKRGNGCYATIAAEDARTGAQLWQRPGYDPGTASGTGCEQDHDPTGGGSTVLVVDPSGRDTLLDVAHGTVVYRAPKGEHVIATDGQVALVRSNDRKQLRVVELDSGQSYTRTVSAAALIGLAPAAVLVADPAGQDPHLVAYDRIGGGVQIDLRSSATVLGIGGDTLVINIGRSFGPVTLTAPA